MSSDNQNISSNDDKISEVANFFENKSILLTGATGFVGVCLVAKLLEACPDLKNIYMLMREKRGKKIEERKEQFLKNFKEFKGERDFSKLIPIGGDVSQENLGLSEENRQLLINEVQIVFHSAASLDFEDKLTNIYNINSIGTIRMLDLSKEMKKLEVFVYVSSAYASAFKLSANEEIYPWDSDRKKFLELVSTLSEEELVKVNPDYQKDHPNAYTYSKHIAEQEVEEYSKHFPCVIVRASMITGSWEYPERGWTISKNGPQGFLMGASRGIIRRLPVAKQLIYDYIPVDVVVNELIVSAFHTATKKPKKLPIYHCTSSTYNPFRWELVSSKINSCLQKYPLKSAVWYPKLKFVESIRAFKISAFFVHIIPALILDTITRVCGGRPILMRLHRNVNSSLERLEKFIFTEWKFSNKATLELQAQLNDVDKERFNLDIGKLNWEDYFEHLAIGVRKYLNNEPLTNLKSAHRKRFLLLLLHSTLQISLILGLSFLLSSISGVKMGWFIPLGLIFFSLI